MEEEEATVLEAEVVTEVATRRPQGEGGPAQGGFGVRGGTPASKKSSEAVQKEPRREEADTLCSRQTARLHLRRRRLTHKSQLNRRRRRTALRKSRPSLAARRREEVGGKALLGTVRRRRQLRCMV